MTNIIDLTETIKEIENEYKTEALYQLERFDIEYTDDKCKVKHYPLHYECSSQEPDQIAHSLKLISDACWFTLNRKLSDAKHSTAKIGILLKEGETKAVNKLKLGKVFIAGPASFSYKKYIPSEVQVYAFQSKDYVRGEINFGIELYD